ncbi:MULTISPECIES: toll/interleukin-1 receptor domain-containing protein [Aequorivita]|uniref:Toll/interleukin-1 receptor domain-containing protein n=1 Tax=Aequorivita iocasae TaxID=2803865 RepID=A0ABX7DQT8_9FLAO|nr:MULTISPECIES: toll/interleukin-1 receptor domain-containing protein [Aequorivita]QQX76454.1 toll/interleukin-1 receptor domain-containing protein [Aequorivita iocasae]UCA55926.1 toll/interleukin-1 receptor domain-containing protein [Aequorivita sp. F7]
MEKIFLSHTSIDKPIVRKFKKLLEVQSFDVWLDEDSILIGDSILKSIERGLLMTDYVLLFISRRALESPWVEKEITAAITLEIEKKDNLILPIVIDDIELPLFLKDKKYIKFNKNYKNCINEIISVIERNKKRLESSKIVSISTDLTLTFDKSGHRTTYLKNQVLKCVRGDYNFHTDGIIVDGKIENIEITKAKIVSIDVVDDKRTFIKSQFTKPLLKNETIERQLKCFLIDCFPESEEYWFIQKWHQSKKMKIIFDFSLERKPYSIDIFENEGTFERIITEEKKVSMEDNRIIYQFEIKATKYATRYVIRWNW